MLVIFDIDGVLADVRHLLPLIQGKHRDYAQFYERIGEALPIELGVWDFLTQDLERSQHICFITGRSERCRTSTHHWLKKHLEGYSFASMPLMMRPDGDERKAHIIKREHMERLLCKGKLDKGFVAYDDNGDNIAMYRQFAEEHGIDYHLYHVVSPSARSQ